MESANGPCGRKCQHSLSKASCCVLSLENGKEGVCGKEGFQCARRNYSVKREKIPPVMTGETSQGESIPEAATWKFTGTNKNWAAQVGHKMQCLCFYFGGCWDRPGSQQVALSQHPIRNTMIYLIYSDDYGFPVMHTKAISVDSFRERIMVTMDKANHVFILH